MIGKSDPYAIISHGNQKFKTNTVKNSQNPHWNYDADFNVPDQGDDRIRVDIFDSDRIGKDKPLGSAYFDIDEVMSKGMLPPGWYPLKGAKSGEVLMSADFEPLRMTSPEPRVSSPKSLQDNAGYPAGKIKPKNKTSVTGSSGLKDGILSVELLAAKNLVKSDLVGKSDPYGVLTLGDQTLKTDVVKNSRNPEWNFRGTFNIGDDTPESLTIKVLDQDKLGKDKPIGFVSLPVKDLINEHYPDSEMWIPLDGVKTGEVLVATNFTPFDDDMLDGRMMGDERMSGHGKGRQSIADQGKDDKLKGLKGTKAKLSSGSLLGDEDGRPGSRKGSSALRGKDSSGNLLGDHFELPPGNIKLTLSKAKNLMKSDLIGKSDPYAVISCGDNTSKTKTVKNDLNPVWDHEVVFSVNEANPDDVKIKVFDADKFGNDKSLGTVNIDLADLAKNGPMFDLWLPLKNAKSGEVQVCAEFEPDFDSMDSDGRLKKHSGVKSSRDDPAHGKKSNVGSHGIHDKGPGENYDENDLVPGVLQLDIIQAKDLVKSDLIGKSDPYAVISFDGDKLKTHTVKNSQNPEWDFTAKIPIDELGPSKIKIDILDADKLGKDKHLGSADINVKDVINGNPLNKDWIPLDGVKSGKVQVSTNFTPEGDLDKKDRKPSRGGAKETRDRMKGKSGRGDGSDNEGDYASSPNSRKQSGALSANRKGSRLASPDQGGISGLSEDDIPAGNLHFKITEAKDLVKADIIGKSDPYAVLTFGDNKLKTNPVKNNQNPVWEFEGDFPVDKDSPRVIKLEVFDCDKIGKDKSLGSTNLDVLDIIENTPIDNTWVPLDGVKSGKVKLSAAFSPEDENGSGSKRPSVVSFSANKNGDSKSGPKKYMDETDVARLGSRKSSGLPGASDGFPGPGNVHVKVQQAKDLVKSDMLGKSDPYATVTHDGNTVKSKVVKNSQNPEWNFDVDIPVDVDSPADLKIEILDSDRFGKDKSLGAAILNLPDVANREPLQDIWIPLRGAKSGHVQVSADYTPEDPNSLNYQATNRGGGAMGAKNRLGNNEEPLSDDDVGKSRKSSGPDSRKPSGFDSRKQSGYDSPKPSGLGDQRRPGDYDEIPSGNIHLEIVQAKDLVKKDLIGKSDPYAIVRYGNDEIKSNTVKNNQNPQWNFECDIPVDSNGPQNLTIDLYDEDSHGKDKPLGSAEIDIPNLVNNSPLDNMWIPLNGVKSGKIQINADFNPDDKFGQSQPYGFDGKRPMEKKTSQLRFGSPDRKSSGSHRKPSGTDSDVIPGNLHLNIIQAKDLVKGDMLGKSDPYAVVTYGNDKVKTNTIKNSQNPEWNFQADIPLRPNGPDVLNIEIFDSDKFGKDKSLGATNIDIPSLQHSQSLADVWVPLDNVKSGQIQLSADFSPDNNYNSSQDGSSPRSGFGRQDPGSRKDSRDYDSSSSRKGSYGDYSSQSSRKGSYDQRQSHGGAKNVKDILTGRKPSSTDSGSLGDPRYGKEPEDKLGTIKLDLLCAKDLMKTDMIGKSDPYAVIQYGENEYRTPVTYNTQDPNFNVQYDIDIPNNPKDRNIIITLYDSDKFGKDVCIGNMNIDIGKVMNIGKMDEDWYPLHGTKSGEIRVGANFIPDGHEVINIHQRYTEDRRTSTQFHEINLNCIPLPSAGGQIDATIRRPSGTVDKPNIDDNNNGTISIKYQPSEDGLHYLDVKYNGDQVQGSPFKFHVSRPASGQAFAHGSGLTHGVCGEPAKFDISTKGAGAGGLSLAVEGPSKAEINCVDNKDGTVSVSYLPTAPGEYKIIAKFADKHIPGSPFTCKVTGDNKKKNQISVGSSSELQLPGDLSESDIRSLKAFIESPSGGLEQCFLKKLPKGNIGISFTPREVGEHQVSVQKNGKHITNSPFKIVVNAQEVGDASRVRVSGDGLQKGMTHVNNMFQINTKSAGYGGLSLSIEGPSKAEIECKDNEDGTLDVEYKPTEPGFYNINIKFADSHIPGSPYQVPITGEGLEKKKENMTRIREAVPVTEVGSQSRLTFKMPGILLKDLEAVVASPSGKVTNANITELEEGVFAVNFVPYELGVHTVTVRYREMDIPGSPFQFTVGPLTDSGAHRVHAG